MGRPKNRQEAEHFVRQNFPDLGDAEFVGFSQSPYAMVVLTDKEAIKISYRREVDGMFFEEMHALHFLSGKMDGAVPQSREMTFDIPAIRMERLSGHPILDKILDEFEIMSAWPAETQEKLGTEIGLLLARLHSLPFTEQDRENMPPRGFIRWDLGYVEGFKEHILARGEIGAAERFENGQNFIKNYTENGEYISFTHMDIGPRNLIRQDNGQLGVIDFGASSVGPSYLDFVRPISFFPKGIWQPMLETYERETGRTIDKELLQGALDHYYSVRVICDVKKAYPEPRHIMPVKLEHS